MKITAFTEKMHRFLITVHFYVDKCGFFYYNINAV